MIKIRIRGRTISIHFYKILSFLCILLIIALAGYAYFISRKVGALEGRLAELKSKNIEFKTEIDRNMGKLSKYRRLLDSLGAYYSLNKIMDEDPLYIEYKNTIRSLIEKRINSIAPEDPLHEGKWFVSKMFLISPTFAMVEYEDGHDLFSIFVQIDKSKNSYSFEVIK